MTIPAARARTAPRARRADAVVRDVGAAAGPLRMEPIEAATARPQLRGADTKEVFLTGVATGLKPNDRLLTTLPSVPCRSVSSGTPHRRRIDHRHRSPRSPSPCCRGKRQNWRRRNSGTLKETPAARRMWRDDVAAEASWPFGPGPLNAITGRGERGNAGAASLGGIQSKVSCRSCASSTRIARQGRYTRLEPWVTALIDELEADVIAPGTYVIAAAAAAASAPRGEGHGCGFSQRAICGLCSTALRKPPSRRWRSRQRGRSLHVRSAPRHTAAAHLAHLTPACRFDLIRRLKNTVVGTTDVRVQALRMSAAPFGHNAPLRPVLDDKGR